MLLNHPLNIKAVIFDLDGTLINSLQDIADAMNRVLQRNRYPVHPVTSYRLFIGNGLKKLTERVLPESNRDEETIQHIHDELMADYGQHYVNKTHLYTGIADLLDSLVAKNLKLAVLSNKADEITQKIATSLLNRWTFQCVIGSGPVARKPDPTGALLCCDRLGVKPSEVLYLGDSGLDMQTAVVSGMIPVGVTWGFRTREELQTKGALFLIDRPEELLNLEII